MASMYEMTRRVRQLVEEIDTSLGTLYKDATIKEIIRSRVDEWARETEYLEGIFPFPVVGGQVEYLLPTDFLEMKLMDDQSPANLLRLEYINVQRYQELIQNISSGVPQYYNLWKNRVRLYPIPATASAATTLNGAIASTATTITLTDASDFPEQGYLRVNNEIIQYNNKATNVFDKAFRA